MGAVPGKKRSWAPTEIMLQQAMYVLLNNGTILSLAISPHVGCGLLLLFKHDNVLPITGYFIIQKSSSLLRLLRLFL